MSKNKKLIMSDYELEKAFNRFKDDKRIINALENGWFIYLRPNGFMVIDPSSLCEYEVKGKIKKPLLSKAQFKKIEQNYCLYN